MKNSDRKNSVDFSFNHCLNLTTLKISSKNTPTRVSVSGCLSLKTGLFLLNEDSAVTGVSTCQQLNKEFDLENKKVELENYMLSHKKMALDMPESIDDLET